MTMNDGYLGLELTRGHGPVLLRRRWLNLNQDGLNSSTLSPYVLAND